MKTVNEQNLSFVLAYCKQVTKMKIIRVTSEAKLPGNLGNNPAVLNLYKECLLKNKHLLHVRVRFPDGFEKTLRLTRLNKRVQSLIMEKLHSEAIAGRHI